MAIEDQIDWNVAGIKVYGYKDSARMQIIIYVSEDLILESLDSQQLEGLQFFMSQIVPRLQADWPGWHINVTFEVPKYDPERTIKTNHRGWSTSRRENYPSLGRRLRGIEEFTED